MAMDTLLVFAASYESVDDAVADYEAVRDIWKETTVGDTYDAAVVTHQEDGKVKIVKHHHEQPTIQGAAIGRSWRRTRCRGSGCLVSRGRDRSWPGCRRRWWRRFGRIGRSCCCRDKAWRI